MLHGGYLAIHRVVTNKFPHLKVYPFFKSRLGKIISILVTQYFVFMAWIPFRQENTDYMLYMMSKFIFISTNLESIISFLNGHKFSIFLIILFIVLNYISYTKKDLLKTISELKLFYWVLILFTIMLGIFLTFERNQEAFIYFRF